MRALNREMIGMLVMGLLLSAAVGCAEAPKKALDDAAAALAAAEARSSCAQEKYDAAAALLAEAKILVKKEQYDAAERKAKAAKSLAEAAKAEADANWDECNRRDAVVAEAKKGDDGDDSAQKPAILQTVYFGYDSAELDESTRANLEENGRWFREHDKQNVLLAGHTDERGSVEYNLALGERRARVARDYLLKLGVEKKRMAVISYGEEMPAAYESNEAAYRRNRRVEFKKQ